MYNTFRSHKVLYAVVRAHVLFRYYSKHKVLWNEKHLEIKRTLNFMSNRNSKESNAAIELFSVLWMYPTSTIYPYSSCKSRERLVVYYDFSSSVCFFNWMSFKGVRCLPSSLRQIDRIEHNWSTYNNLTGLRAPHLYSGTEQPRYW